MSAAMTHSLTSAPEGSLIALTESGYITSEMMVRWGEHFCKYKPQGDPEVGLPDVLLLDGHSTHVFNIEFLNIMSRNNVEVFALPPHTTHELQPLDKSVFKSLKNKWEELAQKAFRLDRHNVSRLNFLKLFKECWDAIATVTNAQAGLRACGIVPFDRSVIPTEAFQPSLATDRSCPPSSNTESIQAPEPVVTAAVPEQVESSGSQVSADVNVSNSETLSTNSQSIVALPPAGAAPTQSTVDSESASVVYAKSNPPTNRPTHTESGLSPSKMDTPTKILHNISPVPRTERSSKRRKKLLQCYRLTSQMHKETVAAGPRPTGTKKKDSRTPVKPSEKRKASEMDQQEKVASQSKQALTMEKKTQKPKKRRTYACIECNGVYCHASDAKRDEEWLSCPTCGKWMHESCFLSHDC